MSECPYRNGQGLTSAHNRLCSFVAFSLAFRAFRSFVSIPLSFLRSFGTLEEGFCKLKQTGSETAQTLPILI